MRFAKSFVLAAASVVPVAAVSADRPPADASPMLKIVAAVEKAGYSPIVDCSFDDGRWEVEAYREDQSLELTIDAKSGKILSEHRDDAETRPPKDAKPLSEVLAILDKAGYADIEDASFERRYWEVEASRENAQRELHVDPKSGEVVSDRVDD